MIVGGVMRGTSNCVVVGRKAKDLRPKQGRSVEGMQEEKRSVGILKKET